MNKNKAVWLVIMLLVLAVALGALVSSMDQSSSSGSSSENTSKGANWFSFSRGTEENASDAGGNTNGAVTREEIQTNITTETGTNSETPPIVGGDRDAHGCIGSAGYQWNEDIGACIRVWELSDTERSAAQTAMQHLGRQYGAAIIEVKQGTCANCFTVTVQSATSRSVVTIENSVVQGTQ